MLAQCRDNSADIGVCDAQLARQEFVKKQRHSMLCYPEWYIIMNKPVIIEACDNDNYNSPSCGHLEHNQRQALPEPELPYSQLDSEGYI